MRRKKSTSDKLMTLFKKEGKLTNILDDNEVKQSIDMQYVD